MIQRAHTDALVAGIPGAQEYIIPGATHQAPQSHAALVNARISASSKVSYLDGFCC